MQHLQILCLLHLKCILHQVDRGVGSYFVWIFEAGVRFTFPKMTILVYRWNLPVYERVPNAASSDTVFAALALFPSSSSWGVGVYFVESSKLELGACCHWRYPSFFDWLNLPSYEWVIYATILDNSFTYIMLVKAFLASILLNLQSSS